MPKVIEILFKTYLLSVIIACVNRYNLDYRSNLCKYIYEFNTFVK